MSCTKHWEKRDWLVLLGFLAFSIAVFSPVLFSRRLSFGIEVDFIRQFYPARYFASDAISNGFFPFWNQHLLCGQPFVASYQTAMFYPPNLLMVAAYGLTGAAFSLKAQVAFVVFHFFLAGAFSYLLCRELDLGRAASAVGGATYMLCGFMVSHAGHLNQHSAAAFIPLVFFFLYRSTARKSFTQAVLGGVVLGVSLLAGHFQPVFYLCVFLLGFAGYSMIRLFRSGEKGISLLFPLGSLALALVVAVGIAAVQLVPTLEFIGLSTRSSIPYSTAVVASLPRWQVVNLVFPKFFGTTPENYIGGWMMWETYGYCGITGGVLAFIALLGKKKGLALFLWIALVLSFVLALGPGGYLWTLFFKAGIFFNRFHDPARTLVIFGFCMSLLAAMGADHMACSLAEGNEEGYRKGLKAASIAAMLACLLAGALVVFMLVRGSKYSVQNGLGFRSLVIPLVLLLIFMAVLFAARKTKSGPKVLGIFLAAVVAVDLVLLNVPWIMVRVNPDDLFGDRAASEYVAERDQTSRVETDANTMYKSLDNGAVYGLEKSTGDDSLVLADFDRYRELIITGTAPGVQPGLFYEPALDSELLDIMGSLYFISRNRINTELARGKLKFVAKRGGVYIYRNTEAMAVAWISDFIALDSNGQVYEKISSTGGKGLVQTSLIVNPGGFKTGEKVNSRPGKLKAKDGEDGSLTVKTDGKAEGLLSTSEIYYPGWEVRVDGRKKQVIKVNSLFRGVIIEKGDRKIEFIYHPGSFIRGAWISLSTIAALMVYFGIVLFLLKRRKAPGEDPVEAVGDNAGL